MPRQPVLVAEVGIGALLAALLFTAGKVFIDAHIGSSGVAKGYRAAGSLVMVLLWDYFSAQVLPVGADFTCVRPTVLVESQRIVQGGPVQPIRASIA